MTPSIEATRAQLLQDPYTAKLAEELGIPISEYVQQVLHFMQHPSEEPQVLVVEDEDLHSQGYTSPREEDMARFLEEAAVVEGSSERTEFTPARKRLVQLSGEAMTPTGSAPRPERSELQVDLETRLREGRLRGGY